MSVPSIAVEKGIDPKVQEDEFVHTVYNEIAPHFSQTRYKPWPIVERFLKSRDDYSVGLDIGCGNGKYLGVNDKLFIIGTDRSDGLITCANENSKGSFNLGVADGLHLPHKDSSFDFAISIAVIHHFSTKERRVDAIKHIVSKLRQGGRALIYCWALEQENSRRGYKDGDEQDILIPWVLQKKQEKKTKSKRDKQLSTISDRSEGINQISSSAEQNPSMNTSKDLVSESQSQTKYRYYHLYKRGELAEDALQCNNCEIFEEGYEKDNWWIVLEKK
ncbi:S-adenosyl-L-methionine-dependent methyltransferase [Suhomyces tanzawaensis NRRL Y-17324]|uniref:S-adenosyl-L-methionine-dependent methyltransferase n=1 Tax=Suhomyces tanzawaensis NRRL Y-17324 TaxID=984487 RepID=A0A1E4SL53_9ASCO|nr:S-adenosyl-L-methionine-dependent methyltransferase [Suhomyces tanzawaensis NRRL Y-17324]ODV80236.1 S-adenosyl-L-methionine-dependent methyltransferase [Suhomyces tanzawaensis NRRL Y-17324]